MKHYFGWNGEERSNGNWPDWAQDFRIEMALLDLNLARGSCKALVKALIPYIANGFVQMGLNDPESEDYLNHCKQTVKQYRLASKALLEYLKRDSKRKDYIITKECLDSFIKWAEEFLA